MQKAKRSLQKKLMFRLCTWRKKYKNKKGFEWLSKMNPPAEEGGGDVLHP